MSKAIWEGAVLAESDDCVLVEGNQYFPLSSVHMQYLKPSAKTTISSWKGIANYYDVQVNGKQNPAAAWYYAEPKVEAENVRDRMAFWKGVRVE